MNRHRLARPILGVLYRARRPLVRFDRHGHVPPSRARLVIEWMIDRVEMWEMAPNFARMEAEAARVEALARAIDELVKAR